MRPPDWSKLDLDATALREATPDPGQIVLWLPAGSQGGLRLWDRVGNLPGAEVTAEAGLCATAATSIRLAQRVQGFFGKLLAPFRRSPGGPIWILPSGASAEPQGERQTDLMLAWTLDEGTSLAEVRVRARWPRAKGLRRLGRGLFLVTGPQPSGGGDGPLPPEGCPREQAECLLAAARQAGDRRREAAALNDLAIVSTNNHEAARGVALLEEALALAERLGDRILEGEVRSNLGLALLKAGQPPGYALGLLEQGLTLARASGDRYAEKLALERLGSGLSSRGAAGRALAAYGEALALARALGDRRHEAELQWQLAVQYAELGRRDEAAEQGQAAVDVLEGMAHPHAAWFAENLHQYRTGESATGLRRPAAPRAQAGGEVVVGAWAPPGQTSGPGLLRMAFSAAKSMAKFLTSGLKTVAAEARQRRLQKCAGCAQHTGLRCRVCGCFTGAKAWLAHEQCPLGKWPE